MKNTQKGFTLIELLITVAVMVFLASILAIFVPQYLQKADNAKAGDYMSNMRFAVGIWQQSNSLPKNVASCSATPFNIGDQQTFLTDLQSVAWNGSVYCITGKDAGWRVVAYMDGPQKNKTRFCVDHKATLTKTVVTEVNSADVTSATAPVPAIPSC